MKRIVSSGPLEAAQSFHGEMAASWEAMGSGGPTLAALAAVCARAVVHPPQAMVAIDVFSNEALAILYVARSRGTIEVRGVRTAFEAPARMLAVYVEKDEDRTVAFRSQTDPRITMRFFEGFCQLCRSGLVLHHLGMDFSLTQAGFELALLVDPAVVAEQLATATDFGLHDS